MRVSAQDAASPIAKPVPVSNIPCRTMLRTTLAALAPNAIRKPISRFRCVTD